MTPRARCRSHALLLWLVWAGLVACTGPTARPTHTAATSKRIMPALPYPATRRDDLTELRFGTQVPDPYRWLEEGQDAAVRTWMDEQDRLARGHLHALPARAALVARLRQLLYVESVSLPVRRGGRLFYSRRHQDREKAVVYYREGDHGAEHVLLDPNKMSPDGSISLGLYVPSQDGRRVAYTLRKNAADEATLLVLDVDRGEVSDIDVINGAKYAQPSWTPAGDGFFYTFLPEREGVPVADRPGLAEVRFHRLGTDPASDPLIHAATGDPQTFVGADLSHDGRWLFAYVQHGWNATDVYYKPLGAARPVPVSSPGTAPRKGREGGGRTAPRTPLPDSADGWQPLVKGVDAQFSVIAHGDWFYIHTNDGAPRWRLLRVAAKDPSRAHWKELVSQSQDAVLEGVQLIGGHLALTYLHHAHHRLEVRTLEGRLVRPLDLPGIGTAAMTGEPDHNEIFYSFTSFTTPPRILRTTLQAEGSELWAEVRVPIDASPYEVRQVWYPSRDGTQISMFLVHRKDLRHDGSTAFLLTGYGGFNISLLPEFSARIFPWLEAGGGLAVPNLRGGGEYGEAWHRAGMGAHKQNTFDDFVMAADYLVRNGYTRPERLGIRGGSNGGLLVGAAMTQRPDLFRAVVCEVPLLDMLRYHLYGSGKTWVPEYGSAEDEAGFRVLLGYSPYHRVRDGVAYPALLMLSADSDDRVDPLHARKMAAAVQAASGSGLPVLLRIERQAGHGGADLLRQAVEQGADTYAFLMAQLGLSPAAP